jgi:carbonic anhydrase/acetyltransferase-like protein (isoleucine patch superfamily)
MTDRALILPYHGVSPRFASPVVHAGEGAAILGRVKLGRNAWIGPHAVLRADGHDVTAGDDFHCGARTTLHIAHEVFACIVGDRVTVGENACVHACTVGSDVVIGDNTVILDGAVVADNVVFEANSTVFPGKKIDGGFLYAGSPAKPVRPLEPGEVAKRRDAIVRASRKDMPKAAQMPAPGSDIHPSVFVASTASLRGKVVAAPSTSIWFSNVFDAGNGVIRIGERTNVQDNTVIRCTGAGVTIAPNSTVGHNVTIHDCTIGSGSLIGIGSTVAPGTIVEDRVLLAAGARTEPGQVLESGWLYAGTPAKKLAPIGDERSAMIAMIVDHYCAYAKDFKAEEAALAEV